MLSLKIGSCIFGHKWTKWTDAQILYTSYTFGQWRKCDRCGVVKHRTGRTQIGASPVDITKAIGNNKVKETNE